MSKEMERIRNKTAGLWKTGWEIYASKSRIGLFEDRSRIFPEQPPNYIE